MAFGKNLILCSPFKGTVITEGGNPATGVELERKWVWGWNDQSGTDRSVSDTNFPMNAVIPFYKTKIVCALLLVFFLSSCSGDERMIQKSGRRYGV